MERILLFVAYGLAGLSAILSVSALAELIRVIIGRWRGSDQGVSFVPLVTFVLAGLACLLGYRRLWLWPLIISLLDPGTWMIPALPWVAWRMYLDWKQEKEHDKTDRDDA